MAEERNPSLGTPTISERAGGVRTRGGRLPPIRSRDLGQPLRRTFTPNIPQRRVKVEKSQQEESNQTSHTDSGSRNDKRGRGRGRGKREYIQVSGSLFGQGLGEEDASLKKESRDSSCLKESSIVKPVFTKKKPKSKKEQLEEEKRYLREDDFDDSGSENEDSIQPIILPLKKTIKAEIKSEPDVKPKIKKENNAEMLKSEIEQKIINKEDIKEKKPVIKNEDILDILSNGDATGKFFVLHYPSNLFLDNETINDVVNTEESSTDKSTENKDVVNDLKNTKEGFVGKLQIYKSGTIKLVCGNTIMNVDQKTLFNFSEELIMMKGSKESGFEITSFGKIDEHLITYPPIGDLLIE